MQHGYEQDYSVLSSLRPGRHSTTQNRVPGQTHPSPRAWLPVCVPGKGDTSTYLLTSGGLQRELCSQSAASLERAEAEQLAHSDQTQTPNGCEQKATSVWISVSESKVAAER